VIGAATATGARPAPWLIIAACGLAVLALGTVTSARAPDVEESAAEVFASAG
jgi:hypothetical protein